VALFYEGNKAVKYLLAAGLICAATSAHALQHPQPAVPLDKGGDPHVRVAHYSPADPVLLVGVVGRPVTITFAPNESIANVNLDEGYNGPDGKPVEAPWNGPSDDAQQRQPIGHILPLWPVRTGRSNAQVITKTDDKVERVYQFVLVALPAQPDDCFDPKSPNDIPDCDDPKVIYGLSFTYPPEKPKADPQAQAAAAERWKAQQKLAAEERLKTDIFYGTRNWKYVAKGEKAAQASLVPDQISDNSAVTGMLFLGNRKVPAIYIVDPDGTERQVTPSPDKDLLVVQETARHWRLRAGSQVVDLYNTGYDPIGANPYTGTTSPEVLRVTRAAETK
jgi:type IV secretion system protein VirB9